MARDKEGLFFKYRLEHSDGRPVDPNGMYFVLKLNSKDKQHALASRRAICAYADSIERYNPILASDLRMWGDSARKPRVPKTRGVGFCMSDFGGRA